MAATEQPLKLFLFRQVAARRGRNPCGAELARFVVGAAYGRWNGIQSTRQRRSLPEAAASHLRVANRGRFRLHARSIAAASAARSPYSSASAAARQSLLTTTTSSSAARLEPHAAKGTGRAPPANPI